MNSSTKPYVNFDAMKNTIDAVRQQPQLGKVSFSMQSQSMGGLALSSQTGPLTQDTEVDDSRRGKFTLVSDEPVGLLGTDLGVSPAEYILKGLAGCYAVTLVSIAASKDIQLDEIKLDLYFDIDLNGFLGIDPSVRNGAQGIRVDVQLTSEGTSRENLDELVQLLPQRSPIHDTLANPVNIATRLI
ncbi:OsmC family protein [Allopusillimonas ginsengisoli]|uniref:OsmC family protein n=1 Tax=Allopusillimonas ginsengisoli TaxID=453575 RepID=UPI0010C1913B|nr:OsmC family protein [Allopusillimonas ginsengisoli]